MGSLPSYAGQLEKIEVPYTDKKRKREAEREIARIMRNDGDLVDDTITTAAVFGLASSLGDGMDG